MGLRASLISRTTDSVMPCEVRQKVQRYGQRSERRTHSGVYGETGYSEDARASVHNINQHDPF